MSSDATRGGPLAGVRVIDATAYASGPLATVMLADQGADVVKVEPLGHGDLMRAIGATSGGMSAIFATLNRNKRSLAVDLTSTGGREILGRLLTDADVVVHNLRPTTAPRLGLDEASVRAVNERIVHCAITGFGESGPYAERGAYDSVVQAMSGVAAHQADRTTGVPRFVQNAMCDKTTGLMAAQAISSALFARERTGEGQSVSLSMLHVAVYFMWSDGMQHVAWIGPDRGDQSRATQPPVRRARDGYLAFSTNQDTEFAALCEILGLNDVAADPRFAEAGARSRNAALLWDRIDTEIAEWTTAELTAALDERHIPHAVVVALEDLHEAEPVVAGDVLAELDQPPGGAMRTVKPVGRFNDWIGQVASPAPRLGEHTDLVLDELGYDPIARAALRDRGVVA